MIIVNVLQDKEGFLRKEIAIDLANLKSLDVTLLSTDVADYNNPKSDEERAEINNKRMGFIAGLSFDAYYNKKTAYYSTIQFHTGSNLTMYFSNQHDGIIAIQTILDAKGRYEWNSKT